MKLNYKRLLEIYLFANTCNYLFKHFRNEDSVRQFADNRNTKDLKMLFNDKIRDIKNIYTLLDIYTIIIAFTYKDYNDDAKEFFEHLDTYNIEWFKDLKSIYLSFARPETIKTIKYSFTDYKINNRLINNLNTSITKVSNDKIE